MSTSLRDRLEALSQRIADWRMEQDGRLRSLEATQHAHADKYSGRRSNMTDEERRAAAEELSKPGRWEPLRTEITHGEATAHAQTLLRHLSMDQPGAPVMVEGSFEMHGKAYTYKAEAQPAPSPAVDRVRNLQDRIRDGSLTLADALAEIGVATTSISEALAPVVQLHNAMEASRDSAPAIPADSLVAEVSDAMIKAECALSDIAEGEETNAAPNTFEWAEQRCAEALAIVRPVMRQHGIRTSEWPPAAQPVSAPLPGESLIERVAGAMHPDSFSPGETWDTEARAAISEVAAWLTEGHGDSGTWCNAAADLMEEINR